MKNPQRLARLNLVNPIMVEAQRPCTEDADRTHTPTTSSDGKRTFRLPPNITLHMLTMSECALGCGCLFALKVLYCWC